MWGDGSWLAWSLLCPRWSPACSRSRALVGGPWPWGGRGSVPASPGRGRSRGGRTAPQGRHPIPQGHRPATALVPHPARAPLAAGATAAARPGCPCVPCAHVGGSRGCCEAAAQRREYPQCHPGETVVPGGKWGVSVLSGCPVPGCPHSGQVSPALGVTTLGDTCEVTAMSGRVGVRLAGGVPGGLSPSRSMTRWVSVFRLVRTGALRP